MEHLYLMPNYFWHKRKIENSDNIQYIYLAIATNIPQGLKTVLVVQGHILSTVRENQLSIVMGRYVNNTKNV